jgi:hypothetical protein
MNIDRYNDLVLPLLTALHDYNHSGSEADAPKWPMPPEPLPTDSSKTTDHRSLSKTQKRSRDA